jgi:serine/threonine protein phosphatase PrpC
MASLTEENIIRIAGKTLPGFSSKKKSTTYEDIFANPNVDGTRSKENQDSIKDTKFQLANGICGILAIVCDGHGRHGSICSQFVIDYLCFHINKKLDSIDDHGNNKIISKILEETFIESHSELLTHLNKKIPNSEIKDGKYLLNSSSKHIICGTTATVALILNQTLFVANCGDSEILLLEPNKKTFVLTTNHEPTSEDEWKRIEKGVEEGVYTPGLKFVFDYPPRDKNGVAILDKHIRDEKGSLTSHKPYSVKNVRNEPGTRVKCNTTSLAFCRTIGDFILQDYGVICTPSVKIYEISTLPANTYLLIMSDGVGDNWTYEDIYTFIFSHDATVDEKLNAFMLENLKRSYRNFGKTMDNQSLIILELSKN